MKIGKFLLLFSTQISFLYSQEIIIKGCVKHDINNFPISHAQILILNTDINGFSNFNGEFVFKVKKYKLKSDIVFLVNKFQFKTKTYKCHVNLDLKECKLKDFTLERFLRAPPGIGLPSINIDGKTFSSNRIPEQDVKIFFDKIDGQAISDLNGNFNFTSEQIDRIKETQIWFFKNNFKISRINRDDLVDKHYKIDLDLVRLEKVDSIYSNIFLKFVDYNNVPVTGLKIRVDGVFYDTLSSDGKFYFDFPCSRTEPLNINYEVSQKDFLEYIEPRTISINLRPGKIDTTIRISRKYVSSLIIKDSLLNISLNNVKVYYTYNGEQKSTTSDLNGLAIIEESIPPQKFILEKEKYNTDTIYVVNNKLDFKDTLYLNGFSKVKIFVKDIFSNTSISNAKMNIKIWRNNKINYDSTDYFTDSNGLMTKIVHCLDTLIIDIKHKDYFISYNQRANGNSTIFLCPLNINIPAFYTDKFNISKLTSSMKISSLINRNRFFHLKIGRIVIDDYRYKVLLNPAFEIPDLKGTILAEFKTEYFKNNFDSFCGVLWDYGLWFDMKLGGNYNANYFYKSILDLNWGFKTGVGLHLNLDEIIPNRIFRFSPGITYNHFQNKTFININQFINCWSLYFSLFSYAVQPDLIFNQISDILSYHIEYEYFFDSRISEDIYKIEDFQLPKWQFQFSILYPVNEYLSGTASYILINGNKVNKQLSSSIWGLKFGIELNLNL
jgi:hypothetical protein